jgi:hypothetical protein
MAGRLQHIDRRIQGHLEQIESRATPMFVKFTDETLPAHDPNFPKPRGLLPVPPEVAESVAQFEAQFVKEHGFPIAPEARQRMLDDWTLRYYYDDAYVVSRRTPQGVEVLAVGWEEAKKYTQDHPPETRRDVRIETV